MTWRSWDVTRYMPTCVEKIPAGSRGVHESTLRSYQILRQVKEMLLRDDSKETILMFIGWAESGDEGDLAGNPLHDPNQHVR